MDLSSDMLIQNELPSGGDERDKLPGVGVAKVQQTMIVGTMCHLESAKRGQPFEMRGRIKPMMTRQNKSHGICREKRWRKVASLW